MSGVLGNVATAIYGVFDRAWTAVCWPLIGLLSGLGEIRDSLSAMGSSAREALSLDLGPLIDKQMTAMTDAISSETKSRLEDIKSLLKRT